MHYKLFILLIVICYGGDAYGQASNRSLGLSKMYFEIDRYVGKQNEPYLSFEDNDEDERLIGRIALYHEYTFYKTRNFNVYWDNKFHTKLTEKQFRHVGWNLSLGVSIYSVEVFLEHHSQHILENKREEDFPLDNHVGIRWYMVK